MLRPSDAHLWVPCSLAGSLLVSGGYEATPMAGEDAVPVSDSRREGTCAGWVAEMVINNNEASAHGMLGEAHSNGWIVDEEMCAHVQNYVNYVRGFGPASAAEVPVELFGLVRGRLDAVSGHNAGEMVCRIFDLKYGWKPVNAERNWAMLCYGLGQMQPGEALELHIYQPRPPHPEGPARVWTILAHEVENWRKWLHRTAQRCVDVPTGTPGEQCTRCPANRSCAALSLNVAAQYEIIRDARTMSIPTDRLAAELEFLELAKDLATARLDALEAETAARITRGAFVEGYSVLPSYSNRAFTVTPHEVFAATGVEPYRKVLKTPAELERDGVPKGVVNKIAKRLLKGRRLTKDDNSIAKRIFGKVKK